jgi:hypothetical protein
MQEKIVNFKNYNCIVCFEKYSNKRTAIRLIDQVDGLSVLMASVNLPDEHVESDEVAIKDYSENEGVLRSLIGASVISYPERYIGSFPICKIL